jgi:hypothetical protein
MFRARLQSMCAGFVDSVGSLFSDGRRIQPLNIHLLIADWPWPREAAALQGGVLLPLTLVRHLALAPHLHWCCSWNRAATGSGASDCCRPGGLDSVEQLSPAACVMLVGSATWACPVSCPCALAPHRSGWCAGQKRLDAWWMCHWVR